MSKKSLSNTLAEKAPQAGEPAPFGNESVSPASPDPAGAAGKPGCQYPFPDGGQSSDGLPVEVGSSGSEDSSNAKELVPPRVVKFDSMLKCVLTQEEIIRYAKEMGDVNAAVTRLEADAKSVAKQYAAKVAEKEARRASLGEMITNGFEHRSVLCNRVFDYESGQVLEVRTDLGEVVETRKMTQAELQQEFDLFEKNRGAA